MINKSCSTRADVYGECRRVFLLIGLLCQGIKDQAEPVLNKITRAILVLSKVCFYTIVWLCIVIWDAYEYGILLFAVLSLYLCIKHIGVLKVNLNKEESKED